MLEHNVVMMLDQICVKFYREILNYGLIIRNVFIGLIMDRV